MDATTQGPPFGVDQPVEGFTNQQRRGGDEEKEAEPMAYVQSLETRLADLIHDVRYPRGGGDIPRAAAVAVTHLETAALWLAKAAGE